MDDVELKGREFGAAIRDAEDTGNEELRKELRKEWAAYKFYLSPVDYGRALRGYYDECGKELFPDNVASQA